MATHEDIANVMLTAHEIREKSYVPCSPPDIGYYTKSGEQACEEACAEFPEILKVVSTMYHEGKAEGWEWAKSMENRSAKVTMRGLQQLCATARITAYARLTEENASKMEVMIQETMNAVNCRQMALSEGAAFMRVMIEEMRRGGSNGC